MENIRIRIIDEVIRQFNEKGMKFTMDDVSSELHISKKTIYKEFKDKDELFMETVDYGFSALKEKEAQIIADDSLDPLEKISKLIICLPDKYQNLDYRLIYQLKEKHPKIYARFMGRISRDWKDTEKLIREAMDNGLIRRVPITVIKLMLEGTVEKFLGTQELTKAGIDYDDSLETMIEILLDGIRT
ncbi:TetR/AcrR family transcriptional regulator [Butyrivibrio sp. X503]|uniref:TetR/AcrR family transcriptional regulator n=1 Tax=Butyrivibrio sp. X503 TaxID=2364878 RepID=UPI000EAA1022|nr:TetR/AcrR family transcriptional regulator [Butyrivibrio sp. X503]RKM58107.1 TetR/AcrR family transcriptional regulator [Butyrivibrio sp. X503]